MCYATRLKYGTINRSVTWIMAVLNPTGLVLKNTLLPMRLKGMPIASHFKGRTNNHHNSLKLHVWRYLGCEVRLVHLRHSGDGENLHSIHFQHGVDSSSNLHHLHISVCRNIWYKLTYITLWTSYIIKKKKLTILSFSINSIKLYTVLNVYIGF